MVSRMIFILIFTCLLQISVQGQESQTYNVNQAVSYGLQNHSRISNEKKNLEYHKWLTKSEKSNYLPSVNTSADYRYNTRLPVTILPSDAFGEQNGGDAPLEIQMGTRNALQGGINLEQQVYDPVTLSRIKEKEIQGDLAEVSMDEIRKEVAIDIKRNYYQAVLNLEIWRTSEEILQNYTALEKAMRTQYENKLISKTELHRIEQKKMNQDEEVAINNMNFQNAVQQLKMSMDYPRGQDLIIADSLVVALVSEQATPQTDSLAYDQLPVYRELSLRENLNQARITTLDKQYHPRISAYGFIGAQYYDDVFQPLQNNNRWYGQSYLGLKLQLNLFKGFARSRHKQTLNIRGNMIDEERQKLASDLQRRESILSEKMLIASKNASKKKNDYMFSYDQFTDRIHDMENGLTDYESVYNSEIEMMVRYQSYLNALLNVLNTQLQYEEVVSVY